MQFKKAIKATILFNGLVYLRYLYFRYIEKKDYKPFKTHKNTKLVKIGSGINFFGYYNLTPVNSRGYILYLTVSKEKIRGSLTEEASIMLLKASEKKALKLGNTKAWNWQQGCMLQWFPGKDDVILFNDYDETKDQYISKVVDLNKKLIRTYPKAVNNVSKCGRYALCLNYGRLAKMRPTYGYFNKKQYELPPDNKDGIWHMDMLKGTTNLIISLEQLKHISYSTTMDDAMHKVNHIDINFSGDRFMFLHRWVGPKGRFMRLVTANPDGSEIFIMNGDKMTSHCCWLNDYEILSYCSYAGETGYFKFTDKGKKAASLIGKMPSVDGHPSVSPDKKNVITDTYPDKSRMSSLFLFNLKNNNLKKIGRFYQPLRYKGEKRIDLHPKWSQDGKSVFFESGHGGKRQLYQISLNRS